jgi:hypothetical protein
MRQTIKSPESAACRLGLGALVKCVERPAATDAPGLCPHPQPRHHRRLGMDGFSARENGPTSALENGSVSTSNIRSERELVALMSQALASSTARRGCHALVPAGQFISRCTFLLDRFGRARALESGSPSMNGPTARREGPLSTAQRPATARARSSVWWKPPGASQRASRSPW